MKIKCDNGNTVSRHMFMPYRNTESSNWSRVKKTPENDYNTTVENLQYQRNSETLHSNTRTAIAEDLSVCNASKINTEREYDATNLNVESEVCNTQYRVRAQNNINILKSCSDKEPCDVEGGTRTFINYSESYTKDRNVSSNTTPVDEEKISDRSESEEMFKNHPRGIVNPNYPGFQHLAHTLLDYSSNIENYYHSENDMTDDDVDLEITESSYEQEPMESEIDVGNKNVNNNEDTYLNDNDLINSILNNSHSGLIKNATICDSTQNEIPDLLRTVGNSNNNVTIDYDLDADIENNFGTRDIIGDFNKEVEDEIKHLLNYNINIQDDLKELRQDIKETFARPIENTINNISEVVNHVIKKLVETHTDQETDTKSVDSSIETEKENISTVSQNIKSEMTLCRPTFLLLEKDANVKITDAVLSDGKDEIKIAYDTENLSINVENTIKQLSTELRKIIPKLDQMRENENIWSKNKNTGRIFTDGNCNEIVNTRNNYINDTNNTRCRAGIRNDVKHNDPGFNSKDQNVTEMRRNSSDTGLPIVLQDDKNKVKSCSENDYKKPSVLENCCPEEYDIGSFDVYNIETALPKLDLDAIENHLKAAKEAERRKRNDREEIRKRLAMGADSEEYYSMGYTDRPGKKPSLHSRLQTGKNLQICFMNEIASDNESQASDIEKNIDISPKSLSRSNIFSKSNYSLNNHPYQTRPLSVNITKHDKISCMQSGAKLRPSTLTSKSKSRSSQSLGHIEVKESDFYALQATLQTEARIALAQAKEMARLQMEASRRGRRGASPVREMVQRGMRAAGAPLAPQRRRVSRQLLTDLNIAQLQVIVNELHSQIEALNESLVKMLMSRDELHMGQDSMLVDIEDLTRYLGVKEQTKKTKGAKSVRRLASATNK